MLVPPEVGRFTVLLWQGKLLPVKFSGSLTPAFKFVPGELMNMCALTVDAMLAAARAALRKCMLMLFQEWLAKAWC